MNESEELRDHALRILAAGLAGVDPERVVVEALADEPILSEWSHAIAGTAPATPLGGGTSADGRTRVVAVGKAAAGMLRGALRVLGDAVDEGVLLMPGSRTTERPSWLPPGIRVHAAGHPLPDEGGVAGARDILRVVEGRGLRDRLLVLISGGGSALLTLPAPGLTLEQLRETTRILLEAGVPIREMNAVRARLEVLKGGGLARAAHPSRVLAYLISDVVGDDPAVMSRSCEGAGCGRSFPVRSGADWRRPASRRRGRAPGAAGKPSQDGSR
ncbi:MAG: glycerate-2-kinase family protein [Gemmatimonadota bacterium]